jgi:endonuclease YncB( thermonuclease family)
MWQAQLIRRGLARQLTVAPNDNFAPLFLEDENAARAQTLGIWGACFGDANP